MDTSNFDLTSQKVVIDINRLSQNNSLIVTDQLFIQIGTYTEATTFKHYYINGHRAICVKGKTEVAKFSNLTFRPVRVEFDFNLCKHQNPHILTGKIAKVEEGWYCDPYQKLLVNKIGTTIKYYSYICGAWVDINNSDDRIVEGEYYEVGFFGKWCFLRSEHIDICSIKRPKMFILDAVPNKTPNKKYHVIAGSLVQKGGFTYLFCDFSKITISPNGVITKHNIARSLKENEITHDLYIEKQINENPTISLSWKFNTDEKDTWDHSIMSDHVIERTPECGETEVYTMATDSSFVYLSSEFECFDLMTCYDSPFLVRQMFMKIEKGYPSDSRTLNISYYQRVLKTLLCLKRLKIKVPKCLLIYIVSFI